MSIDKMREDTSEGIEGILSEYSSFEELFDEIEEDELFRIVENEDAYEELVNLREEDEYNYFINRYLKSLEAIINNSDEESIFNILFVFYDLDKDELETFFNWN